MDLLRIKDLVKRNGERLILIEQGEPEIVMMSFSEYEKLAADSQADNDSLSRRESLETRMKPEEWTDPEAAETEFVTDEAPTAGQRPRFDPVRNKPPGADAVPQAERISNEVEQIRLEDLPL